MRVLGIQDTFHQVAWQGGAAAGHDDAAGCHGNGVAKPVEA
jgi:hypothetical protein